ncbi:MAG: hypothetical protein PHN49_02885 [Candidatus Omnitrophica bacterium]|nr:hypothetical protein [Candidatus Omnitrophota bacterium]MDD5670565.1 hypothetical protein [Candidatus Omnitrophota bacterium]
MIGHIFKQLRAHAPFTLFGALTGIVLMTFFYRISHQVSYYVFYTLHPAHVAISAFVTTSMYLVHQCGGDRKKCKLWLLIAIGYVGSVFVATLSDSLMPFAGEVLLGLPDRHAHIGFIEAWWLVNPLAFAGIIAAYFSPTTKFPHAFHILLSTWASLLHIMMAVGGPLNAMMYVSIFLILFLAVWLPCCFSDIVFPLLFVKDPKSSLKNCSCCH